MRELPRAGARPPLRPPTQKNTPPAGRLHAALGLTALAVATLAAPVVAQDASVADLGAIAARNIGPAGMSGRVSAVDVVLSDPNTIFVGSATGGVFRSTDGGMTWDPVFDDQPVLGIGDVAVFQPNPAIVWVGTGEGNPRNSAGVGNGLFKSIDGGDSWTRVGLEGSERIHRVITHPTDPDIVYVGVMGPAWSDGEVRGVYRTRDGGASFERVLYVDEGTGIADLVMDPSNPDHLLAAMWDFRRDPWFFRSGGPGSGLLRTIDGGDSWTRLTADDGLPEGELGRIGVAFAPSDPDVVYAVVEATRSELLRSTDGGRSFETISDRPGVASRPFYYADLRVDPENENRLYNLFSAIQVSEDQGRSFRTVVPSAIIHGDVHELWIDPSDGRRMIMGNDGGIAFTSDRGETWRFVENLTLAQYYHVTVDDAVPYRIYGGLQDNGSWVGPSDVWENKGILNAHFDRVGGGDGFWVMPDPSDERFGYAASQGGALTRFDRVTGRRTFIRPTHPDGERLRFNWNAAVATDPHDPNRLYMGSQYVHQSDDHGASWRIISPDLTTNDPAKQVEASGGLSQDATGAETHTTILDIAPSALDDQVIWVSSNDGLVHLTRDDGVTWQNVTRDIDVPDGTWTPDVDPSVHDPATAYAVYEDHRRGRWEPYLFRTENYGEDWRRLDTREIEGFIHAVAEDPVEPNLLFVGTEFGLYVSFDRGDDWQLWSHVPRVPIRDLVIHPRDGDLVLGTHGRGLWVVDDISPLRAIAALEGAAPPGLDVYDAPVAYRRPVKEAIGYRSTGMTMWQGASRPYGALLSFWVPASLAEGEASIRILGAGGAVRTASVPVEAGLNRWRWNLRAGGAMDDTPEAAEGMEVYPGSYEFIVSVNGETGTGSVEVRHDPRDPPLNEADHRAWRDRVAAVREAASMVDDASAASDRVEALQESIERLLPDIPAELRSGADDLLDRIAEVETRLFDGPACQGICAGDPVAATVRAPLSRLRGGWGPVTSEERIRLDLASRALATVVAETNDLLLGPAADFRDALEASGWSGLPSLAPVTRGGGVR